MTHTDPAADETITYALIHGGGDVGWVWHLVEAELRARGRQTVAIDLPVENPEATLVDHAQAVADAVGDASQVVVVGHSFGGLTAPIVADLLPSAFLLVLVAAMVPRVGEAPADWWSASGYTALPQTDDGGDELATFYHDVEPELARDAASRAREGYARGLDAPWPLTAWPSVATRHVLFRDDRFFPAALMRRMVRERLGIASDELDGSHCAMLSRPAEVAAYLERAVAETRASAGA